MSNQSQVAPWTEVQTDALLDAVQEEESGSRDRYTVLEKVEAAKPDGPKRTAEAFRSKCEWSNYTGL
jgi:hypothetical protein